jgi:hypothetical protein
MDDVKAARLVDDMKMDDVKAARLVDDMKIRF